MKKMLANTSLLTLSILISMLLLEAIFRIFIPAKGYYSNKDSNLIQPDSLLSYRYTSNLDTTIVTENYQTDIQTNSFGFRDKEWDVHTSPISILVLGNSFSAGFGINNEERWSNLLDVKLSTSENHLTVYNAAVSGYSITQSVDNGIGLSKVMQPEIIIIGLYLNSLDRIDDPFQYYKGFSVRRSAIPYAKVSGGELFFSFWKSDALKSVEVFFKKNSELYQFVEDRIRYGILPSIRGLMESSSELKETTSEYSERSQAAFNELLRLQSSVSAEVYLLPIIQHNRNFEIFEDQVSIYQELASLSSGSEIRFIEILPQFESEVQKGTDMWIKNDPHWNKTAHSLAAEIIIEQLTY